MKINKAVIPAAGLGTRFLPATKAQPKEMIPIVDKPAIQYVVEEAVNSGIESILLVTSRNKQSIEDHFDTSFEIEKALVKSGNVDMLQTLREISRMAKIHFVRQREPLGLGHAVLCAKQFIGNDPFAVLLPDDIILSEKPALKQMIDVYEEYDTEVLGLQTVEPSQVDKYGIVSLLLHTCEDPGAVLWIKDLVEKPPINEAPSNLAVVGRYVLKPSIFSALERTGPGKSGEIQLTDALRQLNTDHSLLGLHLQGLRFDVGEKLGFLQATISLGIKNPDLHKDLFAFIEKLLLEEKRKEGISDEACVNYGRRRIYR